MIRLRLRTLVLVAAGLAAGGFAVFWGGFVNIGASTGHSAVADVLLHTAMRRSVAFNAPATVPVDLADPALVRRAAGHYESGCAPCHGSPAAPRGAVALAMTPPPPDLSTRIDDWRPQDLFWIVKHGVKMTGMPAWPTQQRDDEAWAMTAFLTSLPLLDAAAYRALAHGEEAPAAVGASALSLPGRPALAACARCHGRDGRGEASGAFPRLDIQSEAYLLDSLRAFASGARASGIMQTAVAGLSEAELADLARHYAAAGRDRAAEADGAADADGAAAGAIGAADAGIPTASDTPAPPIPAATATAGPPTPQGETAARLARGEAIARRGLPEDRIGACDGCHDPEAGGGRDAFPRLAGQYRAYLTLQLELFADEEIRRGGGPFADLMATASHKLKPADLEAVAAWYAARPAGGPGR